MDYYTRQRAIVAIGHELQKRGWELLGYHTDDSDHMTDYYSPASWRGIARHKDAPSVLVGVGVSSYDVKNYSGKNEMGVRYEPQSQTVCPSCNGTGNHPDGLTYNQAMANPLGQHAIEWAKAHNQRLVMANVVSPLHYHDNGMPKCLDCHGKGYTEAMKRVDYVRQEWPAFQETPKGRAWHVEKDGQILATGTGLAQAAKDAYGKNSAAEKIADAIEAAAFKASKGNDKPSKPERGPVESTESGKIEVKHEGDWTWVKFPAKPSQNVIDTLKGEFGARFSKKRMAWYIRQKVAAYQVVAAIS